jgi:hypothetical protein
MSLETNDDWIRALRRVQGEFHRSGFELGFQRLFGALLMVGGTFSLRACYERLQHTLDQRELLMPGVVAAVFIASGIWIWRRSGNWYRFGFGQAQLLSSAGKDPLGRGSRRSRTCAARQ